MNYINYGGIMNKNKTVFSNFESDKKNYVKTEKKHYGPFMNEFGEKYD